MAPAEENTRDRSTERRQSGAFPGLFGTEPEVRARPPLAPWLVAGAVVLVTIAVMILAGHRRPKVNGVLPPDPQAGTLAFSELTLSESVSLSGGKSTYVDGEVRNVGTRVVSAATLQALFSNAQALPPQVETLPLSLIRTREPYVDTQPLSAAPLRPGDQRAFRLIFENIAPTGTSSLPRYVSFTYLHSNFQDWHRAKSSGGECPFCPEERSCGRTTRR